MSIQNGEQLLEMMRGYQLSCVIAAAVDLRVFERLSGQPRAARDIASDASCSERGMVILLDALAALGLIQKDEDGYVVPDQLAPFLRKDSSKSSIAQILSGRTVLTTSSITLATVIPSASPSKLRIRRWRRAG